jgi:hypothetical protein
MSQMKGVVFPGDRQVRELIDLAKDDGRCDGLCINSL